MRKNCWSAPEQRGVALANKKSLGRLRPAPWPTPFVDQADKLLAAHVGPFPESISVLFAVLWRAAGPAGPRRGYVFKLDSRGLGYYLDAGSAVAAAHAEREAFHAALAASVEDADGAALGPDAPIIAALRSHKAALDDAEAATDACESAAADWGRVDATLRHRAEVVEVRLTDQLLQLQQMLDDCATADGRATVKAAVGRLRGLGARLLKISQNKGGAQIPISPFSGARV